MRRKPSAILLAFVLMALCAHRVQADAWTQKEKSYLVKVQFSRIDTRQEFNVRGIRAPLFSEFAGVAEGEYSTTDISFYGEYGFTDAFTVIGATQYRQSTSSNVDSFLVQRPNSGFGDVFVAGRVQLLDAPLAGSVQVGVKFPLADTGSAIAVALGNGEMDFEALAAVGKEFYAVGVPWIAQGEWGFHFRGGNYGDEIMYGAQVQAELGGKVQLRGKVDGLITQGKVHAPVFNEQISPGFALTSNRTVMRATAGTSYLVSKKLKFFLDWTTVIDGRNTLAGNIINLGVAFTPGPPNPLTPKP